MRYLDPYVQKCLEALVSKHDSDSLFVKFIDQAVPQANVGALKKKSPAVLAEIFVYIYSALKQHNCSLPKILVKNVARNLGNREVNLTTVVALNKDMPFILRSLIEILRSCKAHVVYILHPVLCVKRDNDGNLTDLVGAEDGGSDESLVYLEIEYMEDAERVLRPALIETYKSLSKCLSDGNGASIEFVSAIDALGKKNLSLLKDWIMSGNFTFFGHAKYVNSGGILKLDDNSTAVLREFSQEYYGVCDESIHMGMAEVSDSKTFRYLHCVDVVERDESNKVIGAHRFFGLFATSVQYQSIESIPLLKDKVAKIKSCSNVKVGGHSHRMMLNVMESFPRQLLFLLSTHEILNDALALADVIWSTNAAVQLRFFGQGVDRKFAYLTICACGITVSLREDIEEILRSKLDAELIEACVGISEYGISRQSFVLRVDASAASDDANVAKVIDDLSLMFKSWDNKLRDNLVVRIGERSANAVMRKWRFPNSYKDAFGHSVAYGDIIKLERLQFKSSIEVELYKTDDSGKAFLKVYTKGSSMDLSDSLPCVENMSMRALDHQSYCVYGGANIFWIHFYTLIVIGAEDVDIDHIKPVFEETLVLVLLGKMENSPLNKLTLRAGLSWRSVFLISALAAYLRQIGCMYTDVYVRDTMVKYPEIVSMLLDLFKARFRPGSNGDREDMSAIVSGKIAERIATVDSVADDFIMRGLLEIIGVAMVRTNYYQNDSSKSYLSFKFLSSRISFLPLPKPFAEIFVYSSTFEGLHLRSDKVSRGGIRWSDRSQDYRTEVLGLMKAQVTKNSIIVPSGAKGSFVVKALDPGTMTRDVYMSAVIERYKTFLCGLLDITDNITAGGIVKPASTICLDDDDPYLVVAADKGTATFSDSANEVSASYNFWLGDAFASGGSAGYDHKNMGITAKGAWVSVVHNLGLMSIDLKRDTITVVGVGDMSGDVFGNGLLMSNHIKLLAAFNHMHIFLDPNPNPEQSYAERKRLFGLPRSTWEDYDKSILSVGAMIVSRKKKSIELTNEVALMLGVKEGTRMTAEKLISAILCMNVTLLWNGGIGTYIKSSQETNERLGDKSNDELRVNGCQVRAKMVAEGGNLGVTQLGRIEYSKSGGLINTDFIDNCGGVHCSDREVNIKIAFSMAISDDKIAIHERNTLLESMQEEVAEMVLSENLMQVKALFVAEIGCKREFSSYCRFIDRLESMGILDSELEFLPNAAVRAKMSMDGAVFNKPELAVVLAYAKIWMRNELDRSKLADDPACSSYLREYFPSLMRDRFADVIERHPLRNDIINNFIVGMIVNSMGIIMVSDIMDALGVAVEVIVRAHLIVRESTGIQWLFDKLVGTMKALTLEFIDFMHETSSLIEYMVRWIVRRGNISDIGSGIKQYSTHFTYLRDNVLLALPSKEVEKQKKYAEHLSTFDLGEELVWCLSSLNSMAGGLDVIDISVDSGVDLLLVARLYLSINDALNTEYMKRILMRAGDNNHWRKVSMIALFDELSDAVADITRSALLGGNHDADYMYVKWQERNSVGIASYKEFISSVAGESMDVQMLLAVRHIKNLVQ